MEVFSCAVIWLFVLQRYTSTDNLSHAIIFLPADNKDIIVVTTIKLLLHLVTVFSTSMNNAGFLLLVWNQPPNAEIMN